MIIRISTITLLLLMGIIPTKGPCKKCKDSGVGEFKSTTSNHMNWGCSHCASKTYITYRCATTLYANTFTPN